VTRFRLIVEYDGRPFMGWQRQAKDPSVQGAIEGAIKAITGENAVVFAAGRTDAGVHGLGMAAHVDVVRLISPFRLMEGLNAKLRPQPVAILACSKAPDTWHARFSCLHRKYVYRVINRRSPLALEKGRAWQVKLPLDDVAMHEAAQLLVGTHDFTTFRSAHCQSKSPVKSIDRIAVLRSGAELAIHVEARSFLHHQVRSIVGCLAMVGHGKWSKQDLKTALEAKDRSALGFNAPPDGLYFAEAVYDEEGLSLR
jgi:tRNA pseudouridine38-40 synthase